MKKIINLSKTITSRLFYLFFGIILAVSAIVVHATIPSTDPGLDQFNDTVSGDVINPAAWNGLVDEVINQIGGTDIRSGEEIVSFFNNTPSSVIAPVVLSPSCTNPKIVSQSIVGSITCFGGGSSDLNSYITNITNSGFDVFLSAGCNVSVGSPNSWNIHWIATCD